MAMTKRAENAVMREALRHQVATLQGEISACRRVPDRVLAADWVVVTTWKDAVQRVMNSPALMSPPSRHARTAKLQEMLTRLEQARALLVEGRTP